MGARMSFQWKASATPPPPGTGTGALMVRESGVR